MGAVFFYYIFWLDYVFFGNVFGLYLGLGIGEELWDMEGNWEKWSGGDGDDDGVVLFGYIYWDELVCIG